MEGTPREHGGEENGRRRQATKQSDSGRFSPEATGEGAVYAGSTVDGTTASGILEDGCRAESQTWPSRSDPALPPTLGYGQMPTGL